MSSTARRVAGAVLLALAERAGAQPTTAIPDAKVGDQVRIQSPWVHGTWISGSLLQANQGFVAVTVGEDRSASLVAPWTKIVSIRLADGRERSAMAAKGALVGFGAALLAGPPLWEHNNLGGSGVNLGLIASLGLPAFGALIGWHASPPRWRTIDWRPSIDTVLPEGEAVRLRLPVETRVTVRAARSTFKARAVSTSDDSLVVRTRSGPRALSWAEVSELRVRGHRDRARGAAVGFTLMAIASGIWLKTDGSQRAARPAEFIVTRIAIGGVVGVLVGTPGWTRVPFPMH